jgi:hypothetical protein
MAEQSSFTVLQQQYSISTTKHFSILYIYNPELFYTLQLQPSTTLYSTATTQYYFIQVQPYTLQLLLFILFISPLFNQVGKLRTISHLQLRPGQDKAKQFDTYNNSELHMK